MKHRGNRIGADIKAIAKRRPIRESIVGALLCAAAIHAESGGWKTQTADDGRITVKSNITERKDGSGKAVPLMEYVATTTDNVSVEKCVSIMKDISKHKVFMGEDDIQLVKTVDQNNWVIYYYFNSPWPLPDSDVVNKMAFSEDTASKAAVFTLTADPSLYPMKKVRRAEHYIVTYKFKDLGNGKAELTSTAEITPAVDLPEWMMRAAFPGFAANILKKIVQLAKAG